MATRTPYSYDPIRHDQIRLLKFVDDGGQTISAVIQPFSTTESLPTYYSISYAWGSVNTYSGGCGAIEIDGMLLPLLDSLYLFVQAVRSRGMLLEDRWWWIDFICIDQANRLEKAEQIHLMKNIYRQADLVICWLGQQSSDSDLAMDFIECHDRTIKQTRNIETIRHKFQTDQYRPAWKALANFLSRKWWSRIWTVQEFVIPERVSFWCGTRDVCRTAVCNSLSVADKCGATGIKKTPGFVHGLNRRRAWDLYRAGADLPLVALAAYFSCMDATDDRDHLYGLMALATDTPPLLDASYVLDSHAVHLRFTQAFIARHRSLDIICFAPLYREELNDEGSTRALKPSWVPEWQKKALHVVPLLVSQSCGSLIGNLRAPQFLEFDSSVCYSASGTRGAEYRFDGTSLHVRGVAIDVVDGLAASRYRKLVQASDYGPAHGSIESDCHYGVDGGDGDGDGKCLSSARTATEVLASVCRSIVLDRKDRFLRYAMPAQEFLRDFISLMAPLVTEWQPCLAADAINASLPPTELQEWFQRTRELRIHGRSFESILRESQAEATGDPKLNQNPNRDEFWQDTFYGRFFDVIVRLSLKLMVSRAGRIGMVAENARKGDLICVLFGCSVPVLLRQQEGDSFTLVTECYLDGCMDGAILERSELAERVFYIR